MPECRSVDKPHSYLIRTAGLWAEAVRQRRPLIINDFAAEDPQRKGYPAGHVELQRYLSVPVFDDSRIVAVAGFANKEEEYGDADVRQATLLMEGMWWTIKRKRAEEALATERKFLIHTCMDGILAHDLAGTIFIFNETAARILGYDQEEVIGKMNIRELYAPGQAQEIDAKIHETGYGGEGILGKL
jgi:GAF domain-containing protein